MQSSILRGAFVFLQTRDNGLLIFVNHIDIVGNIFKETFFMSIYFAGYGQSAFAKERLYDWPRDIGRNADDGRTHDPARSSCGRHRVVDEVESVVRFSLGSKIPARRRECAPIDQDNRSAWKAQGKSNLGACGNASETCNGLRVRVGFVDGTASTGTDPKEVRYPVSPQTYGSVFEKIGIGSQESRAPSVGTGSPKGSSMAKASVAKNSKAGKAIRGVDSLRRRGFFLFDSLCGQDLDVSRDSSNCPSFGPERYLGWSHLGNQSPGPSGV